MTKFIRQRLQDKEGWKVYKLFIDENLCKCSFIIVSFCCCSLICLLNIKHKRNTQMRKFIKVKWKWSVNESILSNVDEVMSLFSFHLQHPHKLALFLGLLYITYRCSITEKDSSLSHITKVLMFLFENKSLFFLLFLVCKYLSIHLQASWSFLIHYIKVCVDESSVQSENFSIHALRAFSFV